ncbi:hypothetical protein Pcinc_017004 [Petrolisthes cinctipes]|uniref:Uncharacterized protein n=1 Tax=Petrolisthes cinctipes TaxID=88211 RepID=A0AAE1FRR5_PETCI|nr:hypothetical protein Pcinc_017004 [Petrolisthes cinctipes]
MHLAPQERRIATTIDFKPGQSLMEFASKLNKKVRVVPKDPTVPFALVKADTKASPPTSSSMDSTRTNFALSCDGLLGLDSLCTHNIDVFPNMHVNFTEKIFHPAMQTPTPLLKPAPPNSVNTIQVICSLTNQKQVVLEGWQRAVPSPCPLQAVVIGKQHIGSTFVARLSVRLKDTVRIHRLALEGTLSTVREGNICDTLITNVTGSPIALKDGVFLGIFEQYDQLPLEEASQVIAGVSNSICADRGKDGVDNLERKYERNAGVFIPFRLHCDGIQEERRECSTLPLLKKWWQCFDWCVL